MVSLPDPPCTTSLPRAVTMVSLPPLPFTVVSIAMLLRSRMISSAAFVPLMTILDRPLTGVLVAFEKATFLKMLVRLVSCQEVQPHSHGHPDESKLLE